MHVVIQKSKNLKQNNDKKNINFFSQKICFVTTDNIIIKNKYLIF